MAKAITKVFKERVYDMAPQVAPSEVLMTIAKQEFGLEQFEIPSAYQDTVVQDLSTRTKFLRG